MAQSVFFFFLNSKAPYFQLNVITVKMIQTPIQMIKPIKHQKRP